MNFYLDGRLFFYGVYKLWVWYVVLLWWCFFWYFSGFLVFFMLVLFFIGCFGREKGIDFEMKVCIMVCVWCNEYLWKYYVEGEVLFFIVWIFSVDIWGWVGVKLR